MSVLVFTPTYRPGGLDVLEASLRRQSYKDFTWIVADEYFPNRTEVWGDIVKRNDFDILFLNAPTLDGNVRNLCALYNAAADYACDNNFDLMVSLQDYIYVPEDGLERFNSLLHKFPTDLYTGVTHISRDPYPNSVVDLTGTYTIFHQPFTSKPKRLSWEDVRVTDMYVGFNEGDVIQAELAHWEANWAAIPVDILEAGARWDTEYDGGIAYENIDFARRANRDFGSNIYLDTGNVAISLPHKDYFEGEREEIEKYSNRELHDSTWLN